MIIEAVGGADAVKDLGVFVIVKVARGTSLPVLLMTETS